MSLERSKKNPGELPPQSEEDRLADEFIVFIAESVEKAQQQGGHVINTMQVIVQAAIDKLTAPLSNTNHHPLTPPTPQSGEKPKE